MAWNVPGVFVASTTAASAVMNQIRDSLKAIGDPWTAYTPTATNITLGNGTVSGAYMSAGKTTLFRAKVVFGSTTTVGGSVTISLPATAAAARVVTASVSYYDSNVPTWQGGFGLNEATGSVRLRTDASAVLSSTVPFTWATGDEIIINGSYEAV